MLAWVGGRPKDLASWRWKAMDELVAGWFEPGVSVGFWEGVQQAAGNVGFTKEEPEGQRAIFCQLSATRKRAILVQDLNAGLKR